jgi:Fe2+ or Zn2+ uptake regulation protein
MVDAELDGLLVGKLRERGQRVTPQRLLIHRVLSSRDQHLTAEQVLDAVSVSLPGTSLPTVYATLELFERLGLVRRVSTGGGALLFDSRVSPHAHAVCRGCGAVSDVDFSGTSIEELGRAAVDGFSPDHAELVIWGRCAECNALSEN